MTDTTEIQERVRAGVKFLTGHNPTWWEKVTWPINVEDHVRGVVEQVLGLGTLTTMLDLNLDHEGMARMGFSQPLPVQDRDYLRELNNCWARALAQARTESAQTVVA